MSETEEEIVKQMGDDADERDADDEQAAEQEQEQEQEAHSVKADDAPRSQKEIESRMKKLEAESERHAKRVAEIMGDDFALLVPSPVDWTAGFIFNVPGMLPDPEQVAALDAILGRAQHAQYKVAKDAARCEDCDGLGDVLTGSQKEGQITKACGSCMGSGWRNVPVQAQPPAVVTNIEAYSNGGSAAPNQFQVADRWGRPAGHPHYGLEPAFVGA